MCGKYGDTNDSNVADKAVGAMRNDSKEQEYDDIGVTNRHQIDRDMIDHQGLFLLDRLEGKVIPSAGIAIVLMNDVILMELIT